MAMRALQLNASSSDGGAARAAVRVHQALCSHGLHHQCTSAFRAISGDASTSEVTVGPPQGQKRLWRHLRPRLSQWRRRAWATANPALHSLAWPDTGLGHELVSAHRLGWFQLLNLHWLGDSTLSVEEIGRLGFPVVWTLHDQWAFSGAEHYAPLDQSISQGMDGGRYAEGYTTSNCPSSEVGCDLNRWTWTRKRRSWINPMTLICPSAWMASCVRQSALMANWPCHVIPNPLDPQQWFPVRCDLARTALGLPLNTSLVLFGAMGGTQDPRKGADLLAQALHCFAAQCADLETAPHLVIFGRASAAAALDFGLSVHHLGHLHDDVSLRLAYSAADVMVVPSRLDNLPNTATEAMACGTPVVAFRTGGIEDIVNDGVNGRLAEPFDPEALAHCITEVVMDPQRQQSMGAEARQQAQTLWHPSRIAAAYAAVYAEVLSGCCDDQQR